MPGDVPIAWQGEAMLLNWSESSTRGRTITLLLPEDEDTHPFRDYSFKSGRRAGQRFMVVFAPIRDDEQPDRSGDLVREAAILCRQQTFWQYLSGATGRWISSEAEAKEALCGHLSIDSRSQLSTDERAAARFRLIAEQYRRATAVFREADEHRP